MEKRIESLVFRRITYADFRHINKIGGGGQSYIDFPTADIPIYNWFQFLGTNTDAGKVGPIWEFDINSLGLELPIKLKIYQRRLQSVCIASQKIHSRDSNRVPSWHPDNGFPDDFDPDKHNLVIYIVKTKDNQYWAGWFLQDVVPINWISNKALKKLFSDVAGYLEFKEKTYFETTNKSWPFYFHAASVANEIPTEEDVENESILEDTSPRLQELIDTKSQPEVLNKLIRIRQRNIKLVKNLKKFYGGKCQITGDKYTFKKKNGEYYSEVHHLIPLGDNGSDSYANAIVVSPLIHRMLHYASVSGINLDNINDNKLRIIINNTEYEVTWHTDHFKVVIDSLKD